MARLAYGEEAMISTQQQFEESVAFELYVLESLQPAIEKESQDSLDLRGSTRNPVVNVTLKEEVCAEVVNRLTMSLAPLLFGAAWKILDLLVELSLNKAGREPNGGEWKITSKVKHAIDGRANPVIPECSRSVWNAVLQVYAATVEHRHCLVHRQAAIDPTNGTLTGVDKEGRSIEPLSRVQQYALSKIAILVTRSTLQMKMDRRTEDHIKYHLNQMIPHMGSRAFSAPPGTAPPVNILLTLQEDAGVLYLDMKGVLEQAQRIFPEIAHFNLLVDIPGDSGRKLIARAEDVPSERTMVDLDALPTWIEYR